VTHIDSAEKPIPCHLHVTEGFVLLLQEGILFYPSKLTFVDMGDLAKIEITLVAQHTFELHVETQGGTLHQFRLPRDKEPDVQEFLRTVQSSNPGSSQAEEGDNDSANEGEGTDDSEDEDEDEDEDGDPMASDGEEYDPSAKNQGDSSCDEEYDSSDNDSNDADDS